MKLTEKQLAAVKGFRDLADLLEAQPALAEMVGFPTIYLFHYGDDTREFARKALSMGDITKESGDTWFNVLREFGPVTLKLCARHEQVCEKVVIDSQEVEVEELDPVLAKEALASVPMIKTTKVVERTEWKCPTLLEASK